jgi:hypothetical protein
MTKPAGTTKVTKDNSRRKYKEAEQWALGKKLGRPKQVFDPSTKTWSKV